jgi:hypothetical protein
MMDRLPRRFQLVRLEDPGGISGVGVVADGVEFADGTAVLRWTTDHRSTAIYDSVDTLLAIHGHAGLTAVRFVDGV